ncbi:ABC transporter substrate-binding protein [Deltaproteobacteria bacterium Smac51]|nr:ABC transporter substrate-binding protein [Deltaproteobacteria bacterium Smac51]
MKKFAFLTLVLILMMSLPAWADKELKFASTVPTPSIDPANNYAGWFTVRYGLGETLLKFDEAMRPVPWLAKAWSLIDENTWKFELNDGVTFHSGRPMTAGAVKESLERLMKINKRAAQELAIVEITAQGQAVIFRTAQPNPTLPNYLCEPYSSIIDVEAAADDENISGTGPYKIQSFKSNDAAMVIKNETYWNGQPKLDRVTIRPIRDGGAMTMALKAGEVDAAEGLPYVNHNVFANDPAYKISSVPTSRVFMIYYNTAKPFTADQAVRQAIGMSIDKEAYSRILLNGAGAPAAGPFPAFLPYGGDKVQARSFDPEGAAGLLEAAGYIDGNGDGLREKDGRKLSLKLCTYAKRVELPVISEALQGQLRDLGVELAVEVVESIDDVLAAGDFDLAAYSYITTPTGDPWSFLNMISATDGLANFGRFSEAKVDALLKEMRSEFAPEKRVETALAVQREILARDGYSFVAHLNMALVMKSTVSGLVAHPSDYYHINVETDISE